MTPKISILIPVYNSSRYLQQCLDSLQRQTMRELEFVVVNDGSTDNSLEIIKQYKKKDSRFTIIDKTNTGYGSSLNLAMKKACGQYIGIVEPDDFCSLDMYEKLWKEALRYNFPNIIRANFYSYSNQKGDQPAHGIPTTEKENVFLLPPAIWSAIYKLDFLTHYGIFFLETPGASYQDLGFFYKTMLTDKQPRFVAQPLYHYRIDNAESSIRSDKKVNSVVIEHASIASFINSRHSSKNGYYVGKFANYLWNINRLSKKTATKFAKTFRNEFQADRAQIDFNEFPLKYRIALEGLLRLPPSAFVSIFRRKLR